uniref:Uncharacterized protein n=1 Tax=Ditylenchus dipsaci TaxID=166011 RepID=A0A915E2A0_9BILA
MDMLAIKEDLSAVELGKEVVDYKLLSINGHQIMWILTLPKDSLPWQYRSVLRCVPRSKMPCQSVWAAKVCVTTNVLCNEGSYKLRCIDLKTSYSHVSYVAHSLMPEELDGEIELQVGVDVKELLLGTPENEFALRCGDMAMCLAVGVSVGCAWAASVIATQKYLSL